MSKAKRDYMGTYESLLKDFPLRPIRTETENDIAGVICDKLTDRIDDLSQAEHDYLEVLSDLIAKFESRWEDEIAEMSPRQLLKYLMSENGLSQSDLSEEFGSPSRVSEFLTGKRELSLSQAKKLAVRFKLKLTAFIEGLPTTKNRKASLVHSRLAKKTA